MCWERSVREYKSFWEPKGRNGPMARYMTKKKYAVQTTARAKSQYL